MIAYEIYLLEVDRLNEQEIDRNKEREKEQLSKLWKDLPYWQAARLQDEYDFHKAKFLSEYNLFGSKNMVQKMLRSAGIEKITLYRGFDEKSSTGEGVNSWTDNIVIAAAYGMGKLKYGDRPPKDWKDIKIAKAEVPVEFVLAHYDVANKTGIGHANSPESIDEHEVIADLPKDYPIEIGRPEDFGLKEKSYLEWKNNRPTYL